MPTTSLTAGSASARTPTLRTASATSRWRSNLAGVVLVPSGGAAVMEMISRSWWMFAWRGAVAVLFGVLALVWPGLTLLWLVALVGLAAGVIAILHPNLTALVLVLWMGANAIVTGILDIAMAIRLRKVIRGEWLLILTGIVAIAFGVLVFLFPAAGALALVWLISFYASLTGVLLLALAWLIRKRAQGSWQGAPAGNQA